MAISVEDLRNDWPQTLLVEGEYGRWVLSRPLPAPFIWRLRDAWLVLTGRAEAALFAQREVAQDGPQTPARTGGSQSPSTDGETEERSDERPTRSEDA